jgi:hypothetical protein
MFGLEKTPVHRIGSKCHLGFEEPRSANFVTYQEGHELAQNYGFFFDEASGEDDMYVQRVL